MLYQSSKSIATLRLMGGERDGGCVERPMAFVIHPWLVNPDEPGTRVGD